MTLQTALGRCEHLIQLARHGALLALVLPFFSANAYAQSIHPLTDIMEGHQVGGVTVDAVGDLYVADFGDLVWKIPPEGQPHIFAEGFCGSSGNAVDHRGNLFQSSYYGNFISKIDRTGHITLLTASGLKGPVGIAIDRTTDDLFVANCNGNTVSRIGGDGVAWTFAQSELLKCPNGVVFDSNDTSQQQKSYVRAHYRDNHIQKQSIEADTFPCLQPFPLKAWDMCASRRIGFT